MSRTFIFFWRYTKYYVRGEVQHKYIELQQGENALEPKSHSKFNLNNSPKAEEKGAFYSYEAVT
jgi:hypothetical protein